MFDIVLAIKLTAHTFSFKKESLRYPTPKRILSALIILPLFFLVIIINRIFMLFDWIVFPGFSKLPLKKMAFIIGVPRSATTYLYNILAKDGEHFTCFKLWEIIFAPSIIQKYILSGIIITDKLLGRPLYRFSLLLDRILFNKISKLHKFSFSDPEEDEMLLLYAFSSMYLSFFFPGVDELDPHLFFDEQITPTKRKKIILFYRRCIQRHVYFFDRGGQKVYLSKNPCFMPKIISLYEAFPGSNLIYMMRSPLKTIPSTISLNANIYSVFSGRISENPLAAKTTDLIIHWYKAADEAIKNYWCDKSMIIFFKKITALPQTTVRDVYNFLNQKPGDAMCIVLENEQKVAANYKSAHKYKEDNAELQKLISSELDFIINGKCKSDI